MLLGNRDLAVLFTADPQGPKQYLAQNRYTFKVISEYTFLREIFLLRTLDPLQFLEPLQRIVVMLPKMMSHSHIHEFIEEDIS